MPIKFVNKAGKEIKNAKKDEGKAYLSKISEPEQVSAPEQISASAPEQVSASKQTDAELGEQIHTVVQLSKATKINQPTRGTSSGSIYRVVAVGDVANLAARYKGETLSIRLEFLDDVDKSAYLDAFKSMKMKDGGGYYSTHLTNLHLSSAQKAIGAFIHGLDIPFDKVDTRVKESIMGGV